LFSQKLTKQTKNISKVHAKKQKKHLKIESTTKNPSKPLSFTLEYLLNLFISVHECHSVISFLFYSAAYDKLRRALFLL